ncbi:MAG: cytochrome b [Burkholderiales bacterium]
MTEHALDARRSRSVSSTRVHRYTGVAIALHWLVALLMLGSFVVGRYMVDLDLSPWKLKVYSWHKWTGVTIFLLVVLRLAWRATHRPPAPPRTTPEWQQHAAGVAHALLYLLMLLVPLSGWVMSSAGGFPVVYFGGIQLPDLVTKDKELFELMKLVHFALNKALLALVILHVAAALKHHYVDRDDVLARMLPNVKPRG